jgi:hypothetical protein
MIPLVTAVVLDPIQGRILSFFLTKIVHNATMGCDEQKLEKFFFFS